MIGIYRITNIINNKVYIGQSINIEDRFAHHRSSLSHNRHENEHLQRSWNKYGAQHFMFEVLEECSEEELDSKERYYINLFDQMNDEHGYNKEDGGSLFKHMSPEAKEKMRIAKIGKYDGEKNPMFGVHLKHSDEWKKKMSERFSGERNPMYGKKVDLSLEWREQQSKRMSGENNPFYGQTHTDETKRKMRENNKRKKKVVCEETGLVYDSACEASRQTGVYVNSIVKCCNGKQHTAGGYHWKKVV